MRDAAEDQRAAGREPVRVPADAGRRVVIRSAPGGARGARRRRARSTPSVVEQRERLVVVEAEVLGRVRVAGQRDRVAGVDHHLQERARRVDLADRLAQPGRRDLDGDARLGDALHRDLVEVAQVPVGPRALGAPQYLTRSGWARMSNIPLAAASPSHSKYVRQTLVGRARRRPDVVAVVVQRAVAEEVDRADDVVPVAALEQLGHAVLAARDEVGLDAQRGRSARARRRSRRRGRRGPSGARARAARPRAPR